MPRTTNLYTVKELAGLAGVTVRTLHHYDRVGLLRPTKRTDAGYRKYGETDLLRLQQVLFYRELGFPLKEIRRVLDSPDFETIAALRRHRSALEERGRDVVRLIHTIDRTLERLTMNDDTVTDAELYEGFSPEELGAMEREVDEKYDPALVAESRRRVRAMTKGEWSALRAEDGEVCRALAALVGSDPATPEVQSLIARHHAWIEKFYPCNALIYHGLAVGYASDARFRAHYDRYREGLADFLSQGMKIFAESLPE